MHTRVSIWALEGVLLELGSWCTLHLTENGWSTSAHQEVQVLAAVVTEPGGPEVLRLQEVAEPVLGADDVLVEVRSTALNRADLIQRRGRYPAPPGSPAIVPGLEMAGVVTRLGQRVQGIQPGDRVFGLLGGGGYAQRAVLPARMAMPIPENLGFEEAASIPEVFFTSYDALFNQCTLSMGERVLIHAVGSGVGVAAVQLAHQAGAATFGTAGSAEKLAKAAALGLDVGINYQEEEFAEVIRERTQGRGVDVVLDVIGGPYWGRNLASLALLGRIILVGSLGGRELDADLELLSSKRLRVHGTVLRARPLEEKIALSQQFEKRLLPLFAAGQLRPVVDRVFPLSQAAEAHAYMETNQNFGKIVLSVQ